MFICFDVPKVVQSPGCDHGHDEESRNGRDMKIDILEGYVWTPERFRASPGKDMGLMGQVREHTSPQGAGALPIGPGRKEKERRQATGGGARPPCPIRIG